MIDPQSCSAELWPLYIVAYAPGVMILFVACITIASIALMARIERDN